MSHINSLTGRVGRRGAVLLVFGMIYIMYGVGLLHEVPDAARRGLTVLQWLCGLSSWAWLWISCGVVACVTAFVPPRQQGRDRAGFIALEVPPVVWASCYLAAWWPLGVYSRGWATASLFFGLAAVVLIVCGWREQDGDR